MIHGEASSLAKCHQARHLGHSQAAIASRCLDVMNNFLIFPCGCVRGITKVTLAGAIGRHNFRRMPK
jgi:hypothetical protein